jgi:hypothetical protein
MSRKQKKSKYNKTYLESRKMVSFVLDKKTDKDIIDWLGKQENQSRSIREALRAEIAYVDMRKEKKNGKM